MSKTKLTAVVLLAAVAAAGAGWKWTRAHPSAAHHERVAGWTWDRQEAGSA
jgi:hypothetical protein